MSRRKTAGRYHHGSLRTALLEQAAAVAAAEGVHAVQVKRLGAALGVSAAAPFRHFPSRQALLVAAAEEGLRRREEAVARAVAAHEDPLERSRAEAVAHVRWAARHPGWYRLLTRPELLEQSSLIREATSFSRERLHEALAPVDEGAVGPGAASLTARALVHGLAQLIVNGHLGPVSPEEAGQLAWAATEVLGQGLAGLAGEGGDSEGAAQLSLAPPDGAESGASSSAQDRGPADPDQNR
jgi:AcrR family transcriptional regulator